MATSSGISVLGNQTLLNRGTYTAATVEIVFAASFPIVLDRVGYAYFLLTNVNSPFQTKVFDRRPIYKPGISSRIPTEYIPANNQLSVLAVWDVPGLSWVVNYN